MNETKTKQSVTQQKSNWKPWQIVLVILLGLCALPVVVPVGFGLLAAAVGIAVALGACVLGLLACRQHCFWADCFSSGQELFRCFMRLAAALRFWAAAL